MRSVLCAAAILLGSTALCWARTSPVRPAPFDFSVSKPPKHRGAVERILDRVDGGGFHGFGSPDGLTRKAEDPLKTMTLRLKFHF